MAIQTVSAFAQLDVGYLGRAGTETEIHDVTMTRAPDLYSSREPFMAATLISVGSDEYFLR